MSGSFNEYQARDITNALRELRELPQTRRNVENLASAVERHTREMKEELLSIRCWLAGLLVVMLLGILTFMIISACYLAR